MKWLPSLRRIKDFPLIVSVGFFLAVRQITRTTIWTTVLIVFVMILTFLNLVVVGGILVGLVEGVSLGFQKYYTGDVLVSTLPTKRYIEQSPELLSILENTPEVAFFTARYVESGQAEANYRERRRTSDLPDRIGATFAGIDPEKEQRVTRLGDFVIEGEYLENDEEGFVIIGGDLIDTYAQGTPEAFVLNGVEVGDKIRTTINGIEKEVTVKGILDSKINEVNLRIYFNEREFRKLAGRDDLNIDEVAITLQSGVPPENIKNLLGAFGYQEEALIRDSKEAQPDFIQEIALTFSILGSVIGSIGLVVASITIFIVIFVNAITRKKFIGILKAIGVRASVIEVSYVFQALFYAVIGIIFGLIILYGFLEPYVMDNPINFPFSDGILFVPFSGTAIRIAILLMATIIAGFIPARLITRGNTLDAVLGR
ncbi:hypothetical protein CL654_02730 [bacterium]|nr:hypothetical protein [bacterium]|tara:strand:+ start:8103 stop:9383 length:1281 start_codon:yes stop_codon:yes gene_type:complete